MSPNPRAYPKTSNTNQVHLGDGSGTGGNNAAALNHSRNVVTECPPAPRLKRVPLPPVQETHPPVPIIIRSGRGHVLPKDTLMMGIKTIGIDRELVFSSEQRPVVRPIATSLPGYANHWGAANDHICSREGSMAIHFDDIARPATSPPLRRLVILVGDGGGFISVNPGGTRGYVAVGDVQRAVVGWMREKQRGGHSFSKRASVNAYGMRDVEVEVWVWRGLVAVPAAGHLWALEL